MNFRCWLAGHRDPQDLRQCGPVRVKVRSRGPATSYQQSGDWSLQDCSPADSRTGGLEDWHLSRLEDWKDLTLDSELKPLAAWWPLSRGAGGLKSRYGPTLHGPGPGPQRPRRGVGGEASDTLLGYTRVEIRRPLGRGATRLRGHCPVFSVKC